MCKDNANEEPTDYSCVIYHSIIQRYSIRYFILIYCVVYLTLLFNEFCLVSAVSLPAVLNTDTCDSLAG